MRRSVWLIVALLLLPLLLSSCVADLPGLNGDNGGNGNGGASATRFVVTFAEPYASAAEMESIITAAGGILVQPLPEIGVAIAQSETTGFATALKSNPKVQGVANDIYMRWIPPKEQRKLEDLSWTASPGVHYPDNWFLQWDKQIIQADKAWEAGYTGNPAVKVAMLDTGIDYATLDLQGAIDTADSTSFANLPTYPGYPDDNSYVSAGCPAEVDPYLGVTVNYSCVGEPSWIDLEGHGTWTAGIVAATGNHRVIGVAPGVTLIAVKVLDRFGWGYFSWMIQGIYYATNLGVDVINMSLGPGRPFPIRGNEALVSAIGRAINWAEIKGTLVMSATGNSNLDADSNHGLFYSNNELNHGLGISATGPTDDRASYSNYGLFITDLAAPGGDFDPTRVAYGLVWGPCDRYSRWFYPPGCYQPHPVYGIGGWITGAQGTSSATPNASGVAALRDSEYGGALNAAELRKDLFVSADDLGTSGTDPIYGWGRVNAYRAVTMP